MGAVHHGDDAPLARPGGEPPDRLDGAGAEEDVLDAQHPGPRPDLRRPRLEQGVLARRRHRWRELAQHQPVPRRNQLPAAPAADVFLRRQEDLVARLEVEPAGHDVHPLGGVAREREGLGRRADERGELGAKGVDVEGCLVEDGLEGAHVRLERLEHRDGQRAPGPGVHEDAVGDQELPANLGPVGLVVGEVMGKRHIRAPRGRGADPGQPGRRREERRRTQQVASVHQRRGKLAASSARSPSEPETIEMATCRRRMAW